MPLICDGDPGNYRGMTDSKGERGLSPKATAAGTETAPASSVPSSREKALSSDRSARNVSINPEAANKPIEPGERIANRYVVERFVAEGGMSIVVAAMHEDLGEQVAIKILKPSFLGDEDLVRRFAREAKTTARIKSDYSVKIYDVGFDDRRGPFMVMEFLEGRDLSQILEVEKRLEGKRAAELFIQACDALAAAHSTKVIHRDVKPQNLFIQKKGSLETLKMLDFGISKAALTGSVLKNDISMVETTTLLGSPVYMSPEQMRSSSKVDARSDIWSFGVSLYEALTGAAPFEAETVTELCALVLEEIPKLPHERIASIDPGLSDVVMKCLKKDPNDRFQNVGELASALLPFAPSRSRGVLESINNVLISTGTNLRLTPQAASSPPDALAAKAETAPAVALHVTQNSVQATAPEQAKSSGPKVLAGLAAVALLASGAVYLSKQQNQVAAPIASVTVADLSTIPSVTALASVSPAPGSALVQLHVHSNAPKSVVLFRGQSHPLPFKAEVDAARTQESFEVTAPGFVGKRYWLTVSGSMELDAPLERN
jgi:serine/threonine protein kinase